MSYQLPVASPANNYHYNKALRIKARYLRNNSTRAEIILWNNVLKGRPIHHYRFLRQRPILYYIADFACLELMLVIEVDGYTHEFDEVKRKDQQKDKYLQAVGFTVLRFSDWEVLNKLDEVYAEINLWINKSDVIATAKGF